MGIIKVGKLLVDTVGGSLSGMAEGAIRDAAIDFFECSRMSSNILGAPATKVVRKEAVNNATDNVITNGSVFNVSHNQAAILVENGKVHDFIIATSEDMAGQYKYDSTVEPSLLGGGFKDFMPGLKSLGNRLLAGGQSTNIMRLYYINCQVITGNPVGFGNITFRDGETGVNVKAQAHGNYEFQIVNPIAFYENYVKRVDIDFSVSSDEGKALIKQMKAEMSPAFQRALGSLSQQGIRYEQLGFYSLEITDLINTTLKEKWLENRGILLKDIPLEITFDEESVQRVLEIQENKNYTDDRMFRASVGRGYMQAAQDAANNTAGAMTGLMGVGMTGGMMSGQMNQFGIGGAMGTAPYQPYDPNSQPTVMASLNGAQPQQNAPTPAPAPQPSAPTPVAPPAAEAWVCACGTTNDGKFCMECGAKKPEPVAVAGWTCACGAVNQGKFCPECGAKKPADAPLYKCDQCGWEPEDPKNPPKFCPQCGDKFDENDASN